MNCKRSISLILLITLLFSLFRTSPALASPPAPEDDPVPVTQPTDQTVNPALRSKSVKPIDQPNIKEVEKIRERERAIANGTYVDLQADGVVTDRVLVILVEFAGTDTFTWTQGTSTWDPLGKADPAEYTGTVGDCSLIVPETDLPAGQSRDYTYGPTLHNTIAAPISATDRSGESIWTPDFSKDWFNSFMFGNGVIMDYTRQDGTAYYKDFTGQSVRDYYLDMSGSTYDIGGDIVGWIQVPHSTWYYDADQCPGARSGTSVIRGAIPGAGNARTLVRDALDVVENLRVNGDPNGLLPANFNWADYDLNGDGVIDRLWIVHAGLGEEDSTTMLNATDYGEAAVWSHSSALTPAYDIGASGIKAGAYIVMPENGGIGVFAHEYGHNLGADDLYAYNGGETSAGFWTLMADDWTGSPIGYEPPAVDPWHLDRWGWLNPVVISDPTQVYNVTLGQASRFPGGDGVTRGVKIQLPDGRVPLAVAPIGSHNWWGGKADLMNSSMMTNTPIAIPAEGATLSFDMVYDIETEWDFLWIQASIDGGTTWNTLTNANTTCTHVAGWIGGEYGMEGQCGFTGYNPAWPSYEPQTFALDPAVYGGQNVVLRFWYMTDWGTAYSGVFIDNVLVTDVTGATTLFSDDAENGGGNWTYAPEWVWSDGYSSYTHNYYLQFRNTTETGGYDSALGDPAWRFGPANSGVLVWYNNNNYTDNEVFSYLNEFPGYGPKGRMLVVDANPEPYRSPTMIAAGYNNEGGNASHRGQMRDATFGLNQGADFTWTNAWAYITTPTTEAFSGRPAQTFFDDSLGYYPGAEYISRGPGYVPPSYRWVTKHWDASATVPATGFYGIKAPGYVGQGADQQEFRYDCASNSTGRLGCYWYGAGTGLGYDGGTGNPGDYGLQYGWHMEVIAQNETTASVRIWNTNDLNQFSVDKATAVQNEEVTYTYAFKPSPIDDMDVFTCTDLDTAKVQYVSGQDVTALPVPCANVTVMSLQGASLAAAVDPSDVVAVAYFNKLDQGETAGFSYTVKVLAGSTTIDQAFHVYNNGVHQVISAAAVTTVDRPYGVALSGDSARVDAPGSVVSYQVGVTNLGNQADTFAISVSGNAWEIVAQDSVGPLQPGETGYATVEVTIPITAEDMAKDVVTVTATSQGDPVILATRDLTTTAYATFSCEISPVTAAATGTPAVDVAYTLQLANHSKLMNDSYTVTVTGNQWPTNVTGLPEALAPGAVANLVVNVSIPEDAAKGAQDVATVTIASVGNPEFKRTATLTTTMGVDPITANNFVVSPSTAASVGVSTVKVSYTLGLTNTYHTAGTYTAAVAGNVWTTEVTGLPTEPLAAGASANLVATVTIPADALSGATDTATITITSVENPNFSRQVALTTTSDNKYSLGATATATTLVSEMGSTAIFEIKVTNNGNVVDSAKLNITDAAPALAAAGWTVTVEGNLDNILPGETRTVLVKVEVPTGFEAEFSQNFKLDIASGTVDTVVVPPIDLVVEVTTIKLYIPAISKPCLSNICSN